MVIGALGVILPVLPGIPLAWLGLFIYALATGFEEISVTVVVIFFILMVLSLVLDFLAPLLGAKKYRASALGVIGAFIGTIVGIFVLGFWGIILGPLAGAFLGELIASGKPKQAFGSAVGAFLGLVAGSLVKLILILIMAGFFIASFF
jgi:uncharacterized protein YqgC (DUF456 family)